MYLFSLLRRQLCRFPKLVVAFQLYGQRFGQDGYILAEHKRDSKGLGVGKREDYIREFGAVPFILGQNEDLSQNIVCTVENPQF